MKKKSKGAKRKLVTLWESMTVAKVKTAKTQLSVVGVWVRV